MATYDLTIGGVQRELRAGSLNFPSVMNGRDVATFDVISLSAAYRPALEAEVQITENGTPIYGGYIDKTEEEGMDGPTADDIKTTVTAVAFNVVLDRVYVDETIAAGQTLKQVLQVLDNYLPSGFTLSGSQVDGPTLPALEFDVELLSSCIDKLTTLTGYIAKITPGKVFSMFLPGTTAAPFDVIDGDGHYVGDIRVTKSRDKYYNSVIGKFGANSVIEKTDTFTGDGSTDEFDLNYALVMNPNVGRGYVTVDGINETLGLSGATWIYDPAANSITRTSAPAFGAAIEIIYNAQFPFTLTAEDASDISLNGLRQTAVSYTDVYDKTVAQDLLDALLAQYLTIKTEVQFDTFGLGLECGQSLTVTAADRNINGTFYITEIQARTEPDDVTLLRRTVKCIDGSTFRGSFRDVYKAWLGNAVSSAGVGPAVSNGVPSSGALYVAILTLDNSEIKAAPDTPILMVGPPATDKRIKPIAASLRVKTSGGAYTNIDTDSASIGLICGGKRMTCGWVNDSYVPVSAFSDLFGVAHDKVADVPVPAMDVIVSMGGSPVGSPATQQRYVMGEDVASLPSASAVSDAGLYFSITNNGAGDFTGGSSSNALKVTVYYVIEDISVPTVASSSCPSPLWSDDFESGAALSADYTNISDLVKTAGVGNGGTQGIEGSGTDSQKFYAEMTKDVNAGTRQGCFTMDYKCSQALWASGGGSAGNYLLEVRDANGVTHFGIYSGGSYAGSPNFGDITIYTTGGGDFDYTGVYSDNVYFTLQVTWVTSSISGAAKQADGSIVVKVDGVTIANLTGLTYGNYNAITNPNNYWDQVHFAPQGAGDNLTIGTT